MSFVAITYGYNFYSIFNTNVGTLSLVDNLIYICLEDMVNNISNRLAYFSKEIDTYSIEEESTKKELRLMEAEKLKEEESLKEQNKTDKLISSPVQKKGALNKC